jgi:hypothetical protein
MATDDREKQFERALAGHLREASSRTCPDAEILAAYHEHTLSLEEIAKWKVHIARCERCQEALALVEQTESVESEEWKEQDAVLMLQQAATKLAPLARADEMRMEEEALPAAKAGAAQVSRGIRRSRAQWKWLVPVGAIAAGVIVWIGSVEVQKQHRQAAESVQIAENRRTAEPPPTAQLATPPTDSLEQKENEAEKSRGDESAARTVAPKAAAKQAIPMAAPSMSARDAGRELAPEFDKKKDATGQGFGNGMGAPAPMTPPPAVSGKVEQGKNETRSVEERDAMIAGGQMKPPVAANQTPASSPPRSRAESTSKLSGGSAGGNLSIITGTVLDPSGAAISGALITAIETSSGTSKTTVADAAGRFQLTELPSDQYEVIVAHAGFAQSEQTITLQPRQNEQVQVQLQLGAVAESVEVSAGAATVNTSSATISSAAKNVNTLLELAAANTQYIVAPDKKAGWRVGDAGKIERTSDNGKTWKLQTSGVSTDLRTGSATSGKVCWIVGKAGTILLTTDGGKHWKQITSPIAEDLGGIHAVDALHASIWDVRNRKSYETSDGGATWKRTANE